VKFWCYLSIYLGLCSGYAEYFSMGVNYTASWRARGNNIEFIVTGNVSDVWLGIGFTDKQMMVG